ncbi:MAG: pyridoxamine 5'-phosphate oxidase family protein [Anaerolineae bacterium]|nr:pyridoxamine 5'-phosphate oxidase family protein [Anaerolineae bacterium]
MNKHLWQRVESLLARHEQATLATCAASEPEASIVTYRTHEDRLYVFVAHASNHLFNLETQPNLVLLTSEWELHGRGQVVEGKTIMPPQSWQAVVRVEPVRIHMLTADGTSYAEPIDVEDGAP